MYTFLGPAFVGPPAGSGGYATLTTFVDLPAPVIYGILSLHIGFAGSGGDDHYGLSSFVHGAVTAVPSPPVLVLALTALAVAAGLARRAPRRALSA